MCVAVRTRDSNGYTCNTHTNTHISTPVVGHVCDEAGRGGRERGAIHGVESEYQRMLTSEGELKAVGARILDPILVGCGAEGDAKLLFGQFLKDYFPTEW